MVQAALLQQDPRHIVDGGEALIGNVSHSVSQLDERLRRGSAKAAAVHT